MDTKREPGPIRPGDPVRIISGAAAGIRGIVSKTGKGKARVISLYRGAYDVPLDFLAPLSKDKGGRTP